MEHRRNNGGLILSSYAAFPPAGEGQDEFQRRLRQLPHICGLELPFSRMGLLQNSTGLDVQEQMGFGWKVVVTFLPAQMENMELDPHFGLASENENSRRAACVEVRRLVSELHSLLGMRPDVELLGISLPTGPRDLNGNNKSATLPEGAVSSLSALRASMRELSDLDYFEKFNFEHCDSKLGCGPIAKGFLSLEEESAVAREFNLGQIVNWGRSTLESHSVDQPMKHLVAIANEAASCKKSSLLRGLILSGSAIQHPLYGDWLDTHAPIREAFHLPGFDNHVQDLGNDSRLLLTLSEARKCWDLAKPAGAFIGIKVQPLPRSLDVESRLRFLERHLEELHAALGL